MSNKTQLNVNSFSLVFHRTEVLLHLFYIFFWKGATDVDNAIKFIVIEHQFKSAFQVSLRKNGENEKHFFCAETSNFLEIKWWKWKLEEFSESDVDAVFDSELR